MSSSNLVRLAFIPEVVYGVTPATGNFSTARFIGEGMSGTPNTVESQQIRTDRLASGQIVTGLEVGGELNFELAREAAIDLFLKSAMYSDWDVAAPVTVALTIDASLKTIERASGSFIGDGLVVGDFLTLSGFTSPLNNTQVMVTEIVDADTIKFVGPENMVSGTGGATAYKRADKLSIGVDKSSFSFEKAFLDLTTKAIIYRGMIVSSFELNIAFGELVGGTFSFSGNDYQTVETAGDFITDGRTINPAATTNTFNGSVDMAFLASSALGALDSADLKIQSLNLNLNNNLSAQNVIGDIAPEDYSPGTAQIEVGLNAYLRNEAWGILAKKLSQESFQLGYIVKNGGGWYGFYLPAIQVSFEDPSSEGQNQDVILDMSGQARVGPNGESSLTIYRS